MKIVIFLLTWITKIVIILFKIKIPNQKSKKAKMKLSINLEKILLKKLKTIPPAKRKAYLNRLYFLTGKDVYRIGDSYKPRTT